MTTLPTWIADFNAQRVAKTPAWLQGRRQQALERFAQEGWPTNKLEAWHHTSLAAFDNQSFAIAPAQTDVSAQVAQLRNNEAGHWLVFVDGRFNAELSDLTGLPEGVLLSTTAQQLAQDSLDADLYGEASEGASPAALNLALAEDGYVLTVAHGQQVSLPVQAVFINTTSEAASFTRNLIRLEAGAHATVVEHHISANDTLSSFSNVVTRAAVARDAKLVHVKLQQESPQASHLAEIVVEQDAASNFESHSFSFGAKLARNNIRTRFNGEHCETLFNGLYYIDGRRHVDHNTVIDHASPNCYSHENYRGILAGMARGVFSGRIVVAEGADGTDAVQRSDSLLLSKLARTDTRPELEIYADDVKCAHGATVGQLDEDNLFYLRSRGIDESDARDLLIYAFAAASLERLDNEALRARAAQGFSALLPGGSVFGG